MKHTSTTHKSSPNDQNDSTNEVDSFESSLNQTDPLTRILLKKQAQLDCVNELAKRLSMSMGVVDVVGIVGACLREMIKPDLVLIYQVQGDELVQMDISGPEDRVDHHSPEKKKVGDCLCGLTAKEGRPVFSKDIHLDDRCTLTECKNAGLRSFAALPIIFDNKTQGVLGLASLEERDFEEDRAFLETVAQHVTWALHRSQLMENERQNCERLNLSRQDLQKARNDLRHDREMLEGIIETSPSGIVVLDGNGRLTLANRMAVEILGIRGDEISDYGYNDADWKITDINGAPMEDEDLPFRRVMSSGDSVYGVVHGIETKGGRKTMLRINATPLKDISGHVVAVVASLADITEELRIQKEFDDQFSLLEGILHKAADGICICHNIDQEPYVRFTHWNTRMTEITGYSMEEINASGWYQSLYPDSETRNRAIDRMSRMREGEDILAEEWPVETKDGNKATLSISTSVLKVKNGRVYVLAIMQDITDRKIAEQKLAEQNRRLFQLNERLKKIVGATKKLATCSNIQDMGRLVLEEFSNNMAAGGGSLYLVQNGRLVLAHTLDPEHAAKTIDLPPKEGTAFRKAIEQKTPVLVRNFDHEPDLDRSGWEGYTDPSALIMPLCREDGEILGVISIHNRTQPPFTQQDKEIALILVSYTCEALRAAHALDELRRSEARFREFYDNAPVMMHSIDKDGIIRKVNNKWLQNMGYEQDEVVGYPVQKLMTPESINCLDEVLPKFWNNKFAKDVRYQYIKNNGEVIDALLNSVVMDDQVWGEISLSVILDITSQRRTEKALIESEEMFRTLFERAGDGIIVVDAEGTDIGDIVSANRAAADMHGYDLEEFVKLNMRDLDTPEEALRMKGILDRVFNGELVTTEHYHRKRDGSVFPLELSTGLIEVKGHKHLLSINRDITERKLYEQKLIESEEFNRRLVHHAPVGILYLDVYGELSFTNPACNRIFGVPEDKPSPILGLNFFDLPLVSSQPEIVQRFKELVNEGKPQHDVEILYQSPITAKEYVLLVSATPRLSADGSIVGSVVMLTDVTQRRKTEEALTNIVEGISGEVGGKFFESAVKHFIKILEADYAHIGEIKTIGAKSVVRTLAYCENGKLGSNFEYDLAGAPCEKAAINGVCSYSEGVSELFPEHESLKHKDIEAYVGICLYDSQDRPIGILVATYKRPLENLEFAETVLKIFASRAAAEIERLENEKALKEREATLSTLLQAAPIGIGQVTGDRKLGWTNQILCSMLGYSGAELFGQSARILYESEEEFLRVGAIKHPEVLKHGRGSVETRIKRKDGTCFDAILSSSSIVKGDLSQGLVFTLMDITERKQLEEQLLRSQKMEAVGTLAGGIAHDFNNLLQVIHGYADFAIYYLQEGQKGFSEIQKIKEAAQSAGELTRSLLTFSRRVESRFKIVDASAEAQNAANILKRTIPRMIQLELRLARDLNPVMADPVQLQQIVMNLCVNARDAMKESGHLIIETYNTYLDEDYCKLHIETKPGAYVVLSVSDTGCGMTKDDMKRMFEPFYTTKEVGKGTGLGLAIVYGIVQNHGGGITCYSEPGHGTTFRIYLPAIKDSDENDDSLPERKALVGGKETVLLVDDEPLVKELGEMILKQFGYTVLTASNGKEGLEIYTRRKDSIDLVILDLIMPKMSGSECLNEIMKIDPSAKILIASGYDANGSIHGALGEGAGAFIRKPYEARELLEAVRNLLD